LNIYFSKVFQTVFNKLSRLFTMSSKRVKRKEEFEEELEKTEAKKSKVEVVFTRTAEKFDEMVSKVIEKVSNALQSDEWEKYTTTISNVSFAKIVEGDKEIASIGFGAWISRNRRLMYGLVIRLVREDGSDRVITVPMFRDEDLEKFVKTMIAFNDSKILEYVDVIKKRLSSGRRRRKIEEVEE